MPATAGRVRMPANNRVHSSAALQTHGIWQSAIGYDPYAPSKDDGKRSVSQNAAAASSAAEPDAENAYASFQGLLALAKITNSTSDEVRGACKRCGRVGHLYVNCKNFLSLKDGAKKDDELLPEAILKKLKGEKVKKRGESSSEESEEDDSESSDSDYDSEIERILAKKAGKSGKDVVERGRSKKRRSGKRDEDSDSEDEGRKKKKKKEKRLRKDSDDDSEEEERRRRLHKRKSRKERRRRRSHRHSSSDEDSSEASPDERRKHKRRSKRANSDSGSDSDDDRRVGRDKKRRRSVKNSRKSRHGDDD